MFRADVCFVKFAQLDSNRSRHTFHFANCQHSQSVALRVVLCCVADDHCHSAFQAALCRRLAFQVKNRRLVVRLKDDLGVTHCNNCSHQRLHTPGMRCALARKHIGSSAIYGFPPSHPFWFPPFVCLPFPFPFLRLLSLLLLPTWSGSVSRRPTHHVSLSLPSLSLSQNFEAKKIVSCLAQPPSHSLSLSRKILKLKMFIAARPKKSQKKKARILSAPFFFRRPPPPSPLPKKKKTATLAFSNSFWV